MTNYELSYIELYNTSRHGDLSDLTEKKQNYILNNYLLMHSIKPESFLKQPERVTKLIEKAQKYYTQVIQQTNTDYNFQNNHASLDIIKRVNNDEYTFAIVKTFWLKLFQRRWKKVYQNKQHITEKMKNPQNLFHRQTHGKWPFNTNIYHI
jgi:hypothetical protein